MGCGVDSIEKNALRSGLTPRKFTEWIDNFAILRSGLGSPKFTEWNCQIGGGQDPPPTPPRASLGLGLVPGFNMGSGAARPSPCQIQ